MTVTAYAGAENYVLHDTMSNGLTLNENSIQVWIGADETTSGTALNASNYTVATSCSDSCTFEVKFTQTYLDSISKETEITVTYSAVLNANAVIGTDGNTNTVKLGYGDSSTVESKTTTYAYTISVHKYDSDDTEKTLLAGAEFQLLSSDGNAISLVKVADADTQYRVAASTDTVTTTTFITVSSGEITITGLETGKYYIREVTAPSGYNIMSDDLEVKITADATSKQATVSYGNSSGTIYIANSTGVEFPETGGMGTTLIYAIGAILVIGAGVLLIVKRRMNREE